MRPVTTGSAPTIGLIGCGAWGQFILRDLLLLGARVEVVARSAESIARAEEGGADAIVATHRELGDLDGLIVATPDTTHADVITEVLDRGVPIYCQKPLTVDPESAHRIVDAAPDRLFCMELWRYHPGVEAIRGIIASGELGRLVGLRSLRWGWGVGRPTSDCTYHLLPHDLSITHELLGALPAASAARVATAGGAPVEMLGWLGDDPWVDIEASIARHRRRREIRALFENGVAWLDDPYAEAIGVATAEGIGSEPEWRRIDDELPMLAQLRAFLAHLDGTGPPPKSSGPEALEAVERLAELRELAGLPRTIAD
jgi:predicted dehydrogenase